MYEIFIVEVEVILFLVGLILMYQLQVEIIIYYLGILIVLEMIQQEFIIDDIEPINYNGNGVAEL